MPTRVPSCPPLVSGAVLGLISMLGGCASPGSTPMPLSPVSEVFPPLATGHHRVLAWVPREHAASAGTAQTVAYIALARAKRATDAELCQGLWIFSGELQPEAAPQPATAPARLGSFSGWQLRIAWQPQLAECGVSAQLYTQTLSRHLPVWMLAQSSPATVLYHQGKMLTAAPTALALRISP